MHELFLNFSFKLNYFWTLLDDQTIKTTAVWRLYLPLPCRDCLHLQNKNRTVFMTSGNFQTSQIKNWIKLGLPTWAVHGPMCVGSFSKQKHKPSYYERTYLSTHKNFLKPNFPVYLAWWRNELWQIVFQLVHSGVFGKGPNFTILTGNHAHPCNCDG